MRISLRPGKPLVTGIAGWLVLSVAWAAGMGLYDLPAWAWWAATVIAAGAVAFDAASALRADALADLAAKRTVPHVLALGVKREVALAIGNAGRRALTLNLHDHYPPGFAAAGQPRTITVAPGTELEVRYEITPQVRGPVQFGRIEAQLSSPLALWQRKAFLGEAEEVRVYPNFAAVAKFALLATDHRLSRIGVKMVRRRGEGMEFHQLREYREGDSVRQIDWKATTRQRKLISREYQDERDQRLVFLLDCSRRMRAQDGAISHFDQVLNSLMLLSHVALKQGDSVGALTFGGVDRWFAPCKGAASLDALTNALYDIQPQPRTGDYLEAATALMRRMPKRSLVIILTNLRDEDEDELDLAVRMLASKHLVVLASLREEVLGQLSERPVRTLDDALTVSSAHRYLDERRRTFARLMQRQTIAVDVEPKELPIALVNQYLRVKRSGRL